MGRRHAQVDRKARFFQPLLVWSGFTTKVRQKRYNDYDILIHVMEICTVPRGVYALLCKATFHRLMALDGPG
jgi:hypothetical protein